MTPRAQDIAALRAFIDSTVKPGETVDESHPAYLASVVLDRLESALGNGLEGLLDKVPEKHTLYLDNTGLEGNYKYEAMIIENGNFEERTNAYGATPTEAVRKAVEGVG